MSREESEQLLSEENGEDGVYLIRESSRNKGQMTLSMRFSGSTKNYRLYYEHGQHYVSDQKRFDTLHDLVADGLISLYVELHASEYIANLTNQCTYEESPYMTLNRGRIQTDIALRQSNRLGSNGSRGSSKSSGSGPKRRSAHYGPDGGIRLITSHDEVNEEPDECEVFQSLSIQEYEKSHNFRTHTFIGSPWCDFCGNFIWGVIGQGVKCEDCGFGAHKKCSELVPNDCWYVFFSNIRVHFSNLFLKVLI